MRLPYLVLLLSLFGQNAFSATNINVGGYMFPPFVNTSSGKPIGLTLDLIELFNQQHSEFNFQFILTSPKRRYIDFRRGKIDALFFESKQWSWDNYSISPTQVFLQGGEVYITKNDNKKTQVYFENIKKRSLVGILGYHYQFANFESNEYKLKRDFDIQLVTSPSTLINQVISQKADIGIITRSFLAKYLVDNPSMKGQLLVSDKSDQTYDHTLLIRNDSLFSVQKANLLINKVINNGTLKALLLKYGLKPTDLPSKINPT